MAINVNKSTDRVEIPTVVLRGAESSEDGSVGSLKDYTITNDIAEDSTVSTNWRNQDAMKFSGNVKITITPDPKFIAASYSVRSSGDIVGETQVNNNKIGVSSETYYTVSGKNPKRTKSNLYTGPFVLSRNESGSDDIVLKVRTYYQGFWSEVFTTIFRIGRTNTNLV